MNTRNRSLDMSVRRATGVVIALALAAAGLGIALPRAEPARALDVPLTGAAKVVVGDDHACALMLDKTVKCWGSNWHEVLARDFGDVSSSDDALEVNGLGGDVFNLAAGNTANCAVLSDFRVQCWGNAHHRVGLGETPYWFVDSERPVEIGNLDGTNDVLGIAAGEFHACALLLNSGSPTRFVVCWGDNYWGQLGNSTIPQQPDPFFVEMPRRPVEFPPMEPVAIAAGRHHTCALADLGHVACWGWGEHGQIGDGQNSDRFTAELVDGIPVRAVDIAAGDAHSCAVLQDGRVQCWGWNGNGELGNTTLTNSNVATLAVIVSAAQITAGSNHTCAVTAQRTVLCWGANGQGQLGDGTRARSLTPQLVPDLGDVVQVDAGGTQTCALLADTSVKCWGDGALTPQTVALEHFDIVEQTAPFDFGDVSADVPNAPPDRPYEYGDAPDQGMSAYPGVPGRFPTLEGPGASGPRHANPLRIHLGDAVSIDAPVDADGLPNLDPANGAANLDLGDDGWLNARDITRFDNCQPVTLRLRVRRSLAAAADAPLYLNAWFDGNRDGDWRDQRGCEIGGPSHEWMVQNHQIPPRLSPAPGGYVDVDVITLPVLSDAPARPAWVRITLSDRPAIAPSDPAGAPPDGRGLSSGTFGYGETEDYLWDPLTPREQYGEWEIRKTVTTSGPVVVGSVLDYAIEVRRLGGSTANVAAALVDVLPPQTSFVSGVGFNELTPVVNPASAVFEAGYGGPSGRVRWIGTLSDGARFRLRYQVRVDACTAAPIDNTAYLILPGPARVLSDTTSTALACAPPPPPSLALSKQMVDAIGSTTFSGGAQISETVYLLTLTQANAPRDLAAALRDALPPGLRAVEVSASRGAITTTQDGRTVSWVGAVGPTLAPPQVWIRARVNGPAQCGRDLVNTAHYAAHLPDGALAQGASGPVTFRPGCAPPPEPTPRPTDVPTEQPTNTPVPVATYTPVPLPTDAPPGSPTNTPVPRPTNTPVPVEPIGEMPVRVLLPIVVR